MVSRVDDSVSNFLRKENPGRSVIALGMSLIGIDTIVWNSCEISNLSGLILLWKKLSTWREANHKPSRSRSHSYRLVALSLGLIVFLKGVGVLAFLETYEESKKVRKKSVQFWLVQFQNVVQ